MTLKHLLLLDYSRASIFETNWKTYVYIEPICSHNRTLEFYVHRYVKIKIVFYVYEYSSFITGIHNLLHTYYICIPLNEYVQKTCHSNAQHTTGTTASGTGKHVQTSVLALDASTITAIRIASRSLNRRSIVF
jgi:hypothetical protein